MQGLPSKILSNSPKTEVLGEKKAMSEAGVEVKNDDFAALFASLTEKGTGTNKSNDVKPEISDSLKNLLIEKNKENAEGKIEEKTEKQTSAVEIIDPKAIQVLMSLASAQNKDIDKNNSENIPEKVEQKITKTSGDIDQLLNGLKETQHSLESVEPFADEGDVGLIQRKHPKKGEHQIENEFNSKSPLDFLINATKNKSVSEKTESAVSKDIVNLPGQKIVMTGEDYLKNIELSEKKESGKLTLLDGQSDLPKNKLQNVKGYGVGLSLLSDPLIKNLKELTLKVSKLPSEPNEGKKEKVEIGLSVIKQDVIPGIQNNYNNQGQPAETQTQINQKVLDLGKLNTTNTNEIIKRISDYVEQNQVANKSSLDLTVKHESLGEFKIQVSKMPNQPLNQAQNLLDMQITTSSKEGHDFFVKNEVSLMKNLNQAGVNLSDFRIISTTNELTPFGQNESRQGGSFKQNSDGTDKQFTSFESNNFSNSSSGDAGNGSQRRKELWEEYQQRYGA